MSNEELFRTAGIRRVPVDTSHFTVQANGTLTLWSGTGTEVSIPSMVNGVRVTAIGNGVFQDRGLTSVTIPDTVTSIGSNAFRGNRLTEVILPGSVIVIGASAFRGNTNIGGIWQGQLRSVFIPDSVTSIGNEAFRGNQLTSVTIPDSVTVIGSNAFDNNRLTDVTIGSSVIAIYNGAFNNNRLTRITVPDSVSTIGQEAFWGLPMIVGNQLTSITIGADQMNLGRNSFGFGFEAFYTQNGRRAGTYTRSGNTWTFTAR